MYESGSVFINKQYFCLGWLNWHRQHLWPCHGIATSNVDQIIFYFMYSAIPDAQSCFSISTSLAGGKPQLLLGRLTEVWLPVSPLWPPPVIFSDIPHSYIAKVGEVPFPRTQRQQALGPYPRPLDLRSNAPMLNHLAMKTFSLLWYQMM